MSKSTWTVFGLVALITPAVLAQMQDNRDKQLDCANGSIVDSRARRCEVREQTYATGGQLSVDPGSNGGVSVKGWTRSDVLVRTRVEAYAPTESEASLLLSQVNSSFAAGLLTATGPERSDKSYWGVSYEIFVPQTQDLKVTARNGGIKIWDVTGRLDVDTRNGGIELKRVVGDIGAKTRNGAVRLELAGNNWQGRKLDVETRNGGVSLAVPANFSAHIQAETLNGAIRSDLGNPVNPSPLTQSPVNAGKRSRKLDLDLGSGGASLRLATTNGAITLSRM
jgi:hypothetical protein